MWHWAEISSALDILPSRRTYLMMRGYHRSWTMPEAQPTRCLPLITLHKPFVEERQLLVIKACLCIFYTKFNSLFLVILEESVYWLYTQLRTSSVVAFFLNSYAVVCMVISSPIHFYDSSILSNRGILVSTLMASYNR